MTRSLYLCLMSIPSRSTVSNVMDDAARRILKATLQERESEYLRHLSELVSIDTQDLGHGIDGGLEEKGQIYLESLTRGFGAETKREPLSEETIAAGIARHGEGNPGHNYANPDRWNLAAFFEKDAAGRSIMFNGHIDTMPPGSRQAAKIDTGKPI